jgi:hypothetical protein
VNEDGETDNAVPSRSFVNLKASKTPKIKYYEYQMQQMLLGGYRGRIEIISR